ncbi:MAG: dihydrolipoamide acetyltransferase family protein [Acidimicrobiales bacterium]
MATTVEMPKLGNTVEDCLISAWLKHVGDTVEAGEVIAEIETDKTSFEINAPTKGVMLATFFPEGALVPVFTPICAIGEPGETVPSVAAGGASAPARGLLETSSAPAQPSPSRAGGAPGDSGATGPGGSGDAAQGRLSPRARRFAAEHELQVGAAKGSGPGGRVLEADLRELLYLSEQQPPVATSLPLGDEVRAATGATAGTPAAKLQKAATAGGEPTAKSGAPLSPVRQKIAKRLRESLSSTAQYTLHTSANAGGLLAVRKRMKASTATAGVNINDLVVFCTVLALLEVPDLNAELIDGTLYRHADINMGFACDTERGLVVPVVHKAQELSLLGLSHRMKELASQAVSGTIAVDDLNGGTFTVTNLGSLGIESFTPVLNPPQVAVLGVDAIGLKAVRKPDGNIEFVDAIGLSLTLDHQVVDGAPGARFLNVVRAKIENAEALCTT